MSAGACKLKLDLCRQLATINAMLDPEVVQDELSKKQNKEILQDACEVLSAAKKNLIKLLMPLADT